MATVSGRETEAGLGNWVGATSHVLHAHARMCVHAPRLAWVQEEEGEQQGGSRSRASRGLQAETSGAGAQGGEQEDGSAAGGGGRKANKQAKGEDGKGVAAKAGKAEGRGASGGVCGLSDPSSGVDYGSHTCR